MSIIAAGSSDIILRKHAVSAGYLLFDLTDVVLMPPTPTRVQEILATGAQLAENKRLLIELSAAVIENVIPLHDVNTPLLFPLAAFIRLEQLFETVVYEVVRKVCLGRPGYAVTRYTAGGERQYIFGDTRSYAAEPDVIIRGAGCVLIDAKYRDFSSGVPHDAIYQLIAHCETFGIKEAMLVGLAEEAAPTEKPLGVSRSGIHISASLVHPTGLQEQLESAVGRAILRAESAFDNIPASSGPESDPASAAKEL